ncbi:MAG: amino acid ABC transporter permease [Xanthobacteraceae bacterium]|jgi:general L-amino acid transport system permease protein|nr:amino acid ABC transporter permease [Xanthobacteraceae bacterium]
MSAAFVRMEPLPPQPAPFAATGMWGWLSRRLFATPGDIAMTIVGFAAFVLIVLPLFRFLVFDAVWTGKDREACVNAAGACWPFVAAKFNQFVYGFYPYEELWRPNLVFAAGMLLLVPLLIPSAPFKRLNAILFFGVYPIAGFVLLTGGNLDPQRFVLGRFIRISDYVDLDAWRGMRATFWIDFAASALLITLAVAIVARIFGTRISASLKAMAVIFLALAILIAPVDADFGLRWVETREWGGLLVTLVVAISGIVAALPIGILLALGRRSEMRLVRWASIAFIEFWRGVPLITVLFFATYMLPLFLPGGANIERLVRALIGVALFSGAYMAEVVRGGLQAVPRHQYESAAALGLGYWKTMGLIVLPQALTNVIPGIVNNFIGLFKDTTLVQIVAILDLLGQVRAAFSDPNWSSPTTLYTGFAFAGIIYFIFCFAMSRYSLFLERRAGTSALRVEGAMR